MSSKFLTVQALTKYIKYKFDADPHLKEVYVKGELSNVKIHTSGHIYFTLKDDAAQMRAVMFRAQASSLAFTPEEGMHVLLRSEVTVYEARGDYQLYVQSMEPDGIGGLFLAFHQLKEALQKEGLFDERFKQPIPRIPATIGVITASTGAVVRDICTTLQRRFPKANIRIYETRVQGTGAAHDIARNIERANDESICDVLIVGRGGGSIEDLWAFNEELVARAIFSSRIPIISAVGHETDTTIADFVADLRAPTPTAAAELAVPNERDVMQTILTYQAQIQQMLNARLTHERARLTRLQQSYPLAQPERLYRPFIERLAQREEQLEQRITIQMMQAKQRYETLAQKLAYEKPNVTLQKQQVHDYTHRLQQAMMQNVSMKQQQFTTAVRTLEALNPLQILSRGFAAVYDANDEVITTVSDVKPGTPIRIAMKDGTVYADVTSTQKEE